MRPRSYKTISGDMKTPHQSCQVANGIQLISNIWLIMTGLE